MSAAPASSVEAGGPWMAGSGQPAAILPARRPPFPFPWVVAGSSCPTSHNPPLPVGKSAFFSMDREMVSAALAAGAGCRCPRPLPLPRCSHCSCAGAEFSPTFSLELPFITADPTPWTLRRRWDASALFISHEPAKPPPSSQRSSPAEPQPARANPRPERFSSFPAAACPIDDCSFEPHPSSLRSSFFFSVSLLSLSACS